MCPSCLAPPCCKQRDDHDNIQMTAVTLLSILAIGQLHMDAVSIGSSPTVLHTNQRMSVVFLRAVPSHVEAVSVDPNFIILYNSSKYICIILIQL